MSNTHGQWLERIRGKKHGEEKSVDPIDRQAAIEIIDGYMNRLVNYIGTPTDNERYAYARGTLLGVERGINALPSVQPKISCDGCRYRGWPTTDMPCRACIRREDNDYYDREK